ncbi:hypothetical protein ACFL2B_01975 [Patescibacteria group bacterium]
MPETNQQSNGTTYWVIGAVLIMVAAFVIIALVLVYTQAEPVTQETDITNISPTVDTLWINDDGSTGANYTAGNPITLIAGDVKPIDIGGEVTDLNGADTIESVALVFRRSGLTNACSADNNECYKVAACTLTANDTDTKNYECEVDLQYFADSTSTGGAYPAETWVADVTVTDNDTVNPLTGNDSLDTNLGTLTALTIPGTINYGTLANNESTSVAGGKTETQTFEQAGNDETDVTVLGNDLGCDAGTIPVGNTQWALTAVDYDDPATTDLTGSSVTAAIDVQYQTSETVAPTSALYWNIYVPYDVSGDCSGAATMTAVAH